MKRAAVAVIGAGPAGCAAAITLARHGAPVTLFERGQRRKDKPCGDAWLPDALEHLDQLGVQLPRMSRSNGKPFGRIVLWDTTRPIWTISLDDQDGWIAPRKHIDHALRDTASRSNDLRYNTSVVGVKKTYPDWEITLRSRTGTLVTERYSAVVLATGAANSLSRRFDISGNPVTGASISVYAQLEGIQAPIFQFAPLGVPGYGWIFPLAGNLVNIGVCAAAASPQNLRSATQLYLDQWQPNNIGPFRAGAGPMWSNQGETWHMNDGLVSCGDAAGLVDPLTGEGIAPALESGINAAQAIQDYLSDRENRSLADYSGWIRSTFRQRYAGTPTRRMWQHLNHATRETIALR